ncbi:uncharacterized protein LOC123677714 isoform X5 [Harmonia axyridis]|nr:uncharacterized protein LOC123677714 isoform X5 [Harmonia axyridis]
MSSQHKKIGKFCKYPFCETTSNRMIRQPSHYSKKNFYKFPKDSRLAKWKKVCNIHPNVKCTHFYICEDHFLPSDFMLNCPIKLNSKAIPKERSMPEEIKEHNYAVSPKDFISTEQSHKKKYEKNTQMHINWARASTDDKINFLNSFFENQENLMCAKPNSQKSIKQDEASPNFICSEQNFNDARHPIKLHINAIPRSLSKDEHNYAHQKTCLLNDHNYAVNSNE